MRKQSGYRHVENNFQCLPRTMGYLWCSSSWLKWIWSLYSDGFLMYSVKLDRGRVGMERNQWEFLYTLHQNWYLLSSILFKGDLGVGHLGVGHLGVGHSITRRKPGTFLGRVWETRTKKGIFWGFEKKRKRGGDSKLWFGSSDSTQSAVFSTISTILI